MLNRAVIRKERAKLRMLLLHNNVIIKLIKQENTIITKIENIYRDESQWILCTPTRAVETHKRIQQLEVELIQLDDRIMYLLRVNE